MPESGSRLACGFFCAANRAMPRASMASVLVRSRSPAQIDGCAERLPSERALPAFKQAVATSSASSLPDNFRGVPGHGSSASANRAGESGSRQLEPLGPRSEPLAHGMNPRKASLEHCISLIDYPIPQRNLDRNRRRGRRSWRSWWWNGRLNPATRRRRKRIQRREFTPLIRPDGPIDIIDEAFDVQACVVLPELLELG